MDYFNLETLQRKGYKVSDGIASKRQAIKPKKVRKNSKNTGKGLESTVDVICEEYSKLGIARIQKVEPATRTFMKGGRPITIFLPNPFLDYTGCWTARGGRSIHIEAKSTKTNSKPRLAMNCKSGGLTEKQIISMKQWHMSGAAVGVIWEVNGNYLWASLDKIENVILTGRKSLSIEHCRPIKQGFGMVLYDFMKCLETDYPQ